MKTTDATRTTTTEVGRFIMPLDIAQHLEGQTVEAVRPATEDEKSMAPAPSHSEPLVIELSGGTTLMAFRDEEINGFGRIGLTTEDNELYVI